MRRPPLDERQRHLPTADTVGGPHVRPRRNGRRAEVVARLGKPDGGCRRQVGERTEPGHGIPARTVIAVLSPSIQQCPCRD